MGFEPTISAVTGQRFGPAKLRPQFDEFLEHELLAFKKQTS